MSGIFSCCVQCREFWTCDKRAKNLREGRPAACCDSCGNFELCKIISGKLKDKPPARRH